MLALCVPSVTLSVPPELSPLNGRLLHLGRIDVGQVERILTGHAGDRARKGRRVVELERAGVPGKGHAAGEGGGDLQRLSRLHRLQLRRVGDGEAGRPRAEAMPSFTRTHSVSVPLPAL